MNLETTFFINFVEKLDGLIFFSIQLLRFSKVFFFFDVRILKVYLLSSCSFYYLIYFIVDTIRYILLIKLQLVINRFYGTIYI